MFTPDGKGYASGGEDGYVRVHQVGQSSFGIYQFLNCFFFSLTRPTSTLSSTTRASASETFPLFWFPFWVSPSATPSDIHSGDKGTLPHNAHTACVALYPRTCRYDKPFKWGRSDWLFEWGESDQIHEWGCWDWTIWQFFYSITGAPLRWLIPTFQELYCAVQIKRRK